MDTYKTDDVYGISRELPLNYVPRPEVDGRLVDDLTRRKHVVIFGSSKQGKTSLRKSWLKSDEYILIQCSNRWGLDDLHASILKQAGYQITQSTKKSISGKNKILAKLSARVFGIGTEAGAEKEGTKTTETVLQDLELDAEDVNDVIRALQTSSFAKYIVLEDFHYLPPETQRDFSVALKAFHEASSLCFVIVGVWLEENRLIVYNGDLSGRVIAVSADRWSTSELEQVIAEGERLLNVRFAQAFKSDLLDACLESVYIVQEVCRIACRDSGVFETAPTIIEVGNGLNVRAGVKSVIEQSSARYESFLRQFADGFQDTELQMYRWLLCPIVTSNPKQLERGLTYSEVRKTIQTQHPQGATLNLGNLTQALQNTAPLQVKKGIKPIILDYDSTARRLNVVDKGFLIWLASQSREDLLEIAGLPVLANGNTPG